MNVFLTVILSLFELPLVKSLYEALWGQGVGFLQGKKKILNSNIINFHDIGLHP